MSEEKYPLLASSGESIVVVLGPRDGTFHMGAYPCYAARYYKSLEKWDERFHTDSRVTDYEIHDGPLPEGCPPLPCAVTNPPPERFRPGVYTSNSGDPVIATKEFSGLLWLLFGRWEAGDWSLNDPWRKPLGDNHLRYLTPDQFAECVAAGAIDAETQSRWKALHDPSVEVPDGYRLATEADLGASGAIASDCGKLWGALDAPLRLVNGNFAGSYTWKYAAVPVDPPKPTYRAYESGDEIEPGAEFGSGDGERLKVVGVTSYSVHLGAGHVIFFPTLLKHWKKTLDGGKTWQPAGLAE